MKIVMIVDDVSPEEAREVMGIIGESMEKHAGWLRNKEYTMGVLDHDCHPVEDVC